MCFDLIIFTKSSSSSEASANCDILSEAANEANEANEGRTRKGERNGLVAMMRILLEYYYMSVVVDIKR